MKTKDSHCSLASNFWRNGVPKQTHQQLWLRSCLTISQSSFYVSCRDVTLLAGPKQSLNAAVRDKTVHDQPYCSSLSQLPLLLCTFYCCLRCSGCFHSPQLVISDYSLRGFFSLRVHRSSHRCSKRLPAISLGSVCFVLAEVDFL